MSNVHGFGGNANPNRRNIPPIRRNEEPHPDNDNGFLDGFSEPVLAEQLRIADQHRILFVSGRRQVKNPQD